MNARTQLREARALATMARTIAASPAPNRAAPAFPRLPFIGPRRYEADPPRIVRRPVNVDAGNVYAICATVAGTWRLRRILLAHTCCVCGEPCPGELAWYDPDGLDVACSTVCVQTSAERAS